MDRRSTVSLELNSHQPVSVFLQSDVRFDLRASFFCFIRIIFVSQENACARCLLKTCICCLWCLEKCLNYLNQVTKSHCCVFTHLLVLTPWSHVSLRVPERICSHGHQQHQFLHVCTRRLRDPGGKRSARRNNQCNRRLCALPGEGEVDLPEVLIQVLHYCVSADLLL